MKTLLSFLFLLFFFSLNAQKYVFGKIVSEDGIELAGVLIMNMNTEEESFSDKDGIFMIKAVANEEIRFVKPNYERFSKMVSSENYNSSMRIVLEHTPQLIEEVEIAFKPTGNLKKDIARLEPPEKVKRLNTNMSSYMKTKPTEAYPTLKTPSTLQNGPNYSVGQGNVLGLLGFLVKKVQKQPTTPNYAEQQAFYRKIHETVDKSYFTKYGLDDFQFEQLVIYADRKYELCKNLRNNFNKLTIENYLKMALKDFLNTRITVQKEDSIKS